jgi:translation initiation factor IF-2
VSASLGAVNEADIKEASHHNAIVLGMDVSASPDALKLAKEK